MTGYALDAAFTRRIEWFRSLATLPPIDLSSIEIPDYLFELIRRGGYAAFDNRGTSGGIRLTRRQLERGLAALRSGNGSFTVDDLINGHAYESTDADLFLKIAWQNWGVSLMTPPAWFRIFRESGFAEWRDNELVTRMRPTHSLTLYRGSTDQPLGVSWTGDPSVAGRYALVDAASATQCGGTRRAAKVWVAEVDPARLFLHCNTDLSVDDDEWVIDTRDLEITEYDGPPIAPPTVNE